MAALGVERPFVYVTSGTEPPSVTFPWRVLFAALADLAVDAVATIGPQVDPAALGAVPVNVRVERFVPQADLLGRATAVVSHGGAGPLLGTASRGRRNCRAVVRRPVGERHRRRRRGCGIVLGPTGRGVQALEQALGTVLAGSSHRDFAIRVADEVGLVHSEGHSSGAFGCDQPNTRGRPQARAGASELGRHLTNSVRAGTWCSCQPRG